MLFKSKTSQFLTTLLFTSAFSKCVYLKYWQVEMILMYLTADYVLFPSFEGNRYKDRY